MYDEIFLPAQLKLIPLRILSDQSKYLVKLHLFVNSALILFFLDVKHLTLRATDNRTDVDFSM